MAVRTALTTTLVLLASCHSRDSYPSDPAAGAFTVMTWNLSAFGLEDRDGDGQLNDPKPDDARDAICSVLLEARADVVALQEMGNPGLFERFRDDLRSRGLDYPFHEILQVGSGEKNLAVLSRFPVVSHRLHTADRYAIGAEQLPVTRGFLEVEIAVDAHRPFRLLAAHLPDKTVHPLGQTEMRRNEARLLGNHVRRILRENPSAPLVVAGDLGDDPTSAAVREILGEPPFRMTDLRPCDPDGNAWTVFFPGIDRYERRDYLLCSESMLVRQAPAQACVVHHPRLAAASDHRPLLAVFALAPSSP